MFKLDGSYTLTKDRERAQRGASFHLFSGLPLTARLLGAGGNWDAT